MLVLPAHSNRRRFLQTLGAGMGALAGQVIDHSASRRAHAESQDTPASRIDPLKPFLPRTPPLVPRARSVIVLFLVGGPSQVDLHDDKPELRKRHGQKLPESFRKPLVGTKFANVLHGTKDELMASPFQWRQYGQSGMWLSELTQHTARHVDDLCFIHSMQADSNNHAPASYQLHTGDIRAGKASLGSWVTYGLGSENQDLPGYVVLFDAGPLGGASNYSNGFLPAAFQPTHLRSQGVPVLDLLPPESFAAGQRDTLDLIRDLNLKHRAARLPRPTDRSGLSGSSPESFTGFDARIASYELAYRMQSAALEVGDLEREPQHVQRSYALDHDDEKTRSFGRKCLLARRLVERGVRFVQLYDMPDKDGWDAHGNIVGNHTPRARWTDQPVAGLLDDLKQRGLLDETLVLWMSEFGRTPTMQGDNGRQHNAAGFTIWMAGAGVKPGRIGATDEFGLLAIDRPVQFRDLHATILTALGLSHEDLFFEFNGRPERLTGVAGSAHVIDGVFS